MAGKALATEMPALSVKDEESATVIHALPRAGRLGSPLDFLRTIRRQYWKTRIVPSLVGGVIAFINALTSGSFRAEA
jgi:hypothetical protein